MIYGIEARQGFVAITGEVGLGKTTLLRSYLERIDQHKLKAIYIFNANISFRSLLKIIFQKFGVEFEAEDLFEMVNRLHQVLIEEYQQGRNVALIIDEAQNMPLETLENLRMLSNLETATEKLVQIVLIGQPEFDHKLNLNELRQLKQRLVIRSTLEPLTDEESMTYILYRLAKVTLDDTLIFTKGALKLILAKAKGTPRTLNILCTNALITGFGYRQKPITAETVKEVLADVAGKKKVPQFKRGLVWVAATICAGVFWLSPYRQVMLAKFGQAGALPHTIEKLQGTNNNNRRKCSMPPILRLMQRALLLPQKTRHQRAPLSQKSARREQRNNQMYLHILPKIMICQQKNSNIAMHLKNCKRYQTKGESCFR
jgi:general secretion pathway protein A